VLAFVSGVSATEMRSRNMLKQLEEYVGESQRFASAREQAELQRATKVARILSNTNDNDKFNYFCKAGSGPTAPLVGDERAVLKAWTAGLGLKVGQPGTTPSRSAYCGEVERAIVPMMQGGMMDKMRFCGAHGEICPEKPPCKPMFPQPTACGCPGKMRPLPPPQATIDVPIPMLPCDYNCICEPPPVITGLPCQDFLPKALAYFDGSGLGEMFSGTQIPSTSQARILASCMVGKQLRGNKDLCAEACYQKVLGNGNEAEVLAVKLFYQAGCTIGCEGLTAKMQSMAMAKSTGSAEFESVLPVAGKYEEAQNFEELQELMAQAEKHMHELRKPQYKKLVGASTPGGAALGAAAGAAALVSGGGASGVAGGLKSMMGGLG